MFTTMLRFKTILSAQSTCWSQLPSQIFNADFQQVPTRAGFLRYMYISTPSARGSCLKISPPPKYFISIQVGGALFNDLIFIFRLFGSCVDKAKLSTLLFHTMNFRRMGIRVYISANSGNQKVKQNSCETQRQQFSGQSFGKLYLRS